MSLFWISLVTMVFKSINWVFFCFCFFFAFGPFCMWYTFSNNFFKCQWEIRTISHFSTRFYITINLFDIFKAISWWYFAVFTLALAQDLGIWCSKFLPKNVKNVLFFGINALKYNIIWLILLQCVCPSIWLSLR